MAVLMRCPDCEKRGVTLRLRPHGEDHYGCRYCGWYAFTDSTSRSDRSGRSWLRAINPVHPDRPAR